MAFDTFELSLEGGSPIEVYTLAIGNDTYRFTSSEEQVTIGPNTFDPFEVERSEVSVSTEERTQTINFTMPSDHPFVQKFVGVVPGQRATLTIQKIHRYDTPTPAAITIFKGLVRSVAFTSGNNEASVAVMPLAGALGRTMPRFTYQGVCAHVLFDTNCKVSAGSFEHMANCSAANGDQITVDGLLAAKGANWAKGGFIQIAGATDFRLILSQTTDVVRVLVPFPSATPLVGTTVSVFAGCAHTLAVCKTKFNNVINYGGFQFVPTKNPFATGL